MSVSPPTIFDMLKNFSKQMSVQQNSELGDNKAKKTQN